MHTGEFTAHPESGVGPNKYETTSMIGTVPFEFTFPFGSRIATLFCPSDSPLYELYLSNKKYEDVEVGGYEGRTVDKKDFGMTEGVVSHPNPPKVFCSERSELKWYNHPKQSKTLFLSNSLRYLYWI